MTLMYNEGILTFGKSRHQGRNLQCEILAIWGRVQSILALDKVKVRHISTSRLLT